eukprot:SAG31_NODE_6660_length_1934_cov_2.343324_3_plen_31_part_00
MYASDEYFTFPEIEINLVLVKGNLVLDLVL